LLILILSKCNHNKKTVANRYSNVANHYQTVSTMGSRYVANRYCGKSLVILHDQTLHILC